MDVRKVFLSCKDEDMKIVRQLGLLEKDPHQIELCDEVLNIPFNSNKAKYIRSNIREKIRKSDFTVCIVGNNTYKCRWVNWILHESEKQGTAIIAMALKGSNKAYFPSFIDLNNTNVYEWDHTYLNYLIENFTPVETSRLN